MNLDEAVKRVTDVRIVSDDEGADNDALNTVIAAAQAGRQIEQAARVYIERLDDSLLGLGDDLPTAQALDDLRSALS